MWTSFTGAPQQLRAPTRPDPKRGDPAELIHMRHSPGVKGYGGSSPKSSHPAKPTNAPCKSYRRPEDKVYGEQLEARPFCEDQRPIVGGHLDHVAQNETGFFTEAFKIGDIAHAPRRVSRLKGRVERCI
jgi:hypothetical protein